VVRRQGPRRRGFVVPADVRGRAGAHGRREEDEARTGGMSQGRGLHGRQGVDRCTTAKAPALWPQVNIVVAQAPLMISHSALHSFFGRKKKRRMAWNTIFIEILHVR
jgi:hypothetical protein